MGATPEKKVVKCPYKNKFVLRTAARGASFLQGRPQGAACKVRPAGSFSAMRKRRAGLECNSKSKSSGASLFAKAARRVFFTMKKSKAGLGRRPKNETQKNARRGAGHKSNIRCTAVYFL